MDFAFTEEQTLLRNLVQRYLADNYKYEDWRKFTRGEAGRDQSTGASSRSLGCSRLRCRKSMMAWAAARSNQWSS